MNNFEQAKNSIENKFKNLELLEYNGYYNDALFLDKEFGEFYANFQTVSIGGKKHPERVIKERKERLFNKAKEKLSSKYTNYTLLEFNGTSKLCKVLDHEYGEFSGIFNNIFLGRKRHPKRLENKKPEQTLKASKKPSPQELLESRFDYLVLLEYGGSKTESKFLDKEYGEFYGRFSKVIGGHKRHPARAAKNKKEASKRENVKNKRKKTCLEKYGHTTPLLNDKIKDKIKNTYLDKYGVSNPMAHDSVKSKANKTKIKNGNAININGLTASEAYKQSDLKCSATTFLNLLKVIDPKEALNYVTKKTDIEYIMSLILDSLILDYKFNKYLEGTKYRPDFILKDKNIIIETDGLKFHSDLYISDKNYHKNKMNTYNAMGYSSLFFRSDEILNKTDIVKSIIKAKCNILDNKYYARKCKIQIVNSKESKEWFNKNHLMGGGSGETAALIYDNKIVASMSIIKRKEYLEISRFCNEINSVVVGGFNKLLKFFMNKYNLLKVISFVDARYGDGSSLIKNGFVEASDHLSFKWTDFNNTFHRMKYPGNTGYQHNLYKVWDCGQKKFILER